jgi:hypothetical protein
MSTFSSTLLYPGVNGNTATTNTAPPADKQALPVQSPKQGQQSRILSLFGGGGLGPKPWPFYPPGPIPMGGWNYAGSGNNPWGWIGPGEPWLGTWGTYAWMLKHPKIAHVLSDILNPIMEAPLEVVADDGITQDIQDAVFQQFSLLKRKYTEDAFRSLYHGTVAFETVWRRDEYLKLTVIDQYAPQAHMGLQILTDPAGNFAGIRPPAWVRLPPAQAPQAYLGVLYSFIVKFNAEAGSVWGQSILENVRETAWKGWLKAFGNIGKMGTKVSGILGMLLYPAGTYDDGSGGAGIDFEKAADAAVQGLMNNQFVTMQNLSLGGATPREMAELASKSLVDLKVVDMGDQAHAITGFVEEMLHYENLMAEGLLTSPTVGSDTAHSSRSTSEQHTIMALRFSEKLNMDFVEAQNDRFGPVANFVAFNFGEKYRGRVRLAAVPINDEHIQGQRSFIAAGMNQPNVAGALMKMADVERMMTNIGIPVAKPMSKADAAALVAPNPVQPPDGKIPDAKVDKAPSDKNPNPNV